MLFLICNHSFALGNCAHRAVCLSFATLPVGAPSVGARHCASQRSCAILQAKSFACMHFVSVKSVGAAPQMRALSWCFNAIFELPLNKVLLKYTFKPVHVFAILDPIAPLVVGRAKVQAA